MNKNKGAIYIATTTRAYLKTALTSALLLRELNPTLPIRMVVEKNIIQPFPFDQYGIEIVLVSALPEQAHGYYSREIKTQLNKYSEYDKTIYIDADVIPIKAIPSWIWEEVGDFKIALDFNDTVGKCNHISRQEREYTIQQYGEQAPQFNSGVILWKNNDKTDNLFNLWHNEWSRFNKHDQLALTRALGISENNMSVSILDKRYHCSLLETPYYLAINAQVYFVHCWRDVETGNFKRIASLLQPKIVQLIDMSMPD